MTADCIINTDFWVTQSLVSCDARMVPYDIIRGKFFPGQNRGNCMHVLAILSAVKALFLSNISTVRPDVTETFVQGFRQYKKLNVIKFCVSLESNRYLNGRNQVNHKC
jgi:hypothetical protein